MLRVSAKPIADGSGFAGWRGTVSDITSEFESQRLAAFLRGHDPVTGLFNRYGLGGAFAAALGIEAGRGGAALVLALDLDGFRAVNDTIGSARGDELLRQVGRRLTRAGQAGDLFARVAGDEFVIVRLGSKLDERSVKFIENASR